MPMVRAMRMLNAIEAGMTTGSELETLLTGDAGRLADLSVLLALRGQARRIAATSTAMNAVAESSTAMNAVVASSTAIAAVAASSTAMSAVIASSAAKMAVFNSDTALAAIAASSTALTAMRASASYSLYGGTTGTISGPSSDGSYIVLGLSSTNGTNGTVTISTRRSGSSISNSQVANLPTANDGKTYNVAIPVVSPFSVSNSASGWTWFVGMFRCDI